MEQSSGGIKSLSIFFTLVRRTIRYKPQDIIYREDVGRLNSVFIVLNGTCTISQCLRMKVDYGNGKNSFQLADVEVIQSASRVIVERVYKAADELRQNKDTYRPLTAGFRKVINVNKTTKKECSKDLLTRSVEVGHYGVGTAFGLGEQMEDRNIFAKTDVECLLIPRYWLFQSEQNLGNIWQKIKMYLDWAIPSRHQIFKLYLINRKWTKYKRKLIADLYKLHPIKNCAQISDIPMMCRIHEQYE